MNAQASRIESEAIKAIIDELGYSDMTVPSDKFNDDDFYLINPLTRQIKAQFGHTQRLQAERAAVNGLQAVRCMRAKHMNLWRLPARRVA